MKINYSEKLINYAFDRFTRMQALEKIGREQKEQAEAAKTAKINTEEYLFNSKQPETPADPNKISTEDYLFTTKQAIEYTNAYDTVATLVGVYYTLIDEDSFSNIPGELKMIADSGIVVKQYYEHPHDHMYVMYYNLWQLRLHAPEELKEEISNLFEIMSNVCPALAQRLDEELADIK